MTFGEKIKKARNERKMTQKTLAETLNVAESSISDWEHDRHKPDVDTLKLLCETLEISADYLLFDAK